MRGYVLRKPEYLTLGITVCCRCWGTTDDLTSQRQEKLVREQAWSHSIERDFKGMTSYIW